MNKSEMVAYVRVAEKKFSATARNQMGVQLVQLPFQHTGKSAQHSASSIVYVLCKMQPPRVVIAQSVRTRGPTQHGNEAPVHNRTHDWVRPELPAGSCLAVCLAL